MENKKALKLIDKILNNLEANGIDKDSLIQDLKDLREYALEQQVPLVVKVLRLTYEHIEKNDNFLIPIPDDEPIEITEGELIDNNDTNLNPIESLMYLIALLKDLKNKMNLMDLGEYRNALLA